MKNLIHKWHKGFFIGVGALIISTLGIQASDELQGIAGQLSGAVATAEKVCGNYAEPILFGTHTICMDVFEASPSPSCLYDTINNQLETETNLTIGECRALSIPDTLPWSFVTYTQAQQLCARSGKRLPRNEEWYKVAIGLSDPSTCFADTKGVVNKTGVSECVTPTKIHDLAGNVWEWMDDVVKDGRYKERLLPMSGYVNLVDGEGVVIETTENANLSFGKDYAWVNSEGMRGILRGGFYGSGEDGGIFSQNASVALDFSSVGVGFRCVRDL